jgi:hypothetical protein
MRTSCPRRAGNLLPAGMGHFVTGPGTGAPLASAISLVPWSAGRGPIWGARAAAPRAGEVTGARRTGRSCDHLAAKT